MSLHSKTPEEIVSAVQAGSLRVAGQLISAFENNDPTLLPVLQQLFKLAGRAKIIGITGPPGAGKSTIVDCLINHYRGQHLSVAVLAIDPSSPFSGGAILGDRVRMSRHDNDDKVFVRSMASRGQLGGLARAAADTLNLLDVMGWDVVLLETVGVGQSEIDIVRHADSVVLLQTPESGDAVQSVKAGVMEIGDVFLVNKSDHDDADKMVRHLAEMLSFHQAKNRWNPEIVKTQGNSQVGIDTLASAISAHQQFLQEHEEYARQRRHQQLRFRILDVCNQLTARAIFSDAPNQQLSDYLEALTDRTTDPYTVAQTLIKSVE